MANIEVIQSIEDHYMDKHTAILLPFSSDPRWGCSQSVLLVIVIDIHSPGAADLRTQIMKNRILSREDKEEDITFYEDQKTCRKMYMGGRDKGYRSAAEKKFIRDAREERYRPVSKTNSMFVNIGFSKQEEVI